MVALGIVADDLTGATTVAAVLARSGVRNAVLFATDSVAEVAAQDVDALIVSTDSRPLPAATARERVADATKRLQRAGATSFSKRIDTTCRGGIGAEVEGMLSVLPEDVVAVIVPAMPQSKRIVVGGYSLIDSTLLARTGAGVDVRTPVTESHLPTLFARQFADPIGFVCVRDVVQGPSAIAAAMRAQRQEGHRAILIDATSLEDVEAIAQAVVDLGWNVICVDPGPFTERLAVRNGAVTQVASPDRDRRDESVPTDTGTVIVVAGSATAVTHQQTVNLLQVPGTVAVEVDLARLIGDEETFGFECDRVRARARSLADQAAPPRVLVIGLPSSLRGEVVDLGALEANLGLPAGSGPARLPERLGLVARAAAEELYRELAGFYLTGGDVMVGGCRALDAHGIRLVDYVIPQADQGVILGGPFDSVPVIGKGGLTGGPMTAVQCVNRIFDERK